MNTRRLALLMLIAVAPLGAHAAEAAEAEAEARLMQHVDYLAAPRLEGRLTGTDGARLAADYLVERLEELGALPLPGAEGFRLPFAFTAGMNDGGSSLALAVDGRSKTRRYAGADQIQGLSFSDTATVSGPVVFAGYGLVVPEGKDFGYDSYHGLDVEDKIVVVLRYFPEDVDQEARATLARYAGLRYKAMTARENGAKALVVVTGPRSPNAGKVAPMTFDTALSGSGIVAASVSGKLAKAIFANADKGSLEEIQASLDTGNPHITGFDIPGITLTLDVKVDRERREGFNVVGYLPAASGPAGADDSFVVLGAHFDHLGHGRHNNSLARKGEVGKVHHGADDNASGVAAVLEAGRALSQRGLARPVALAFWSGEELGLLGSTDFTAEGPIPTDRIHAYLNFDMVGRLRDNRLNLQSAGSSSVWPKLVEQANVPVGLDVDLQDDPYLPTDSSIFYQSGVPTLSFFTGSHEDYHRPTDTADTLNYEGLEEIARFATLLTRKLADLEGRPDYLTVVRKTESGGDRDSVRAFTGTIPDYTTEVQGLQLSGVIEGGPADKAGLKGGDVIVEFGGQTIANIYDYTYALDAVKIGEPLKVVYMRDGKRGETEIIPTARP